MGKVQALKMISYSKKIEKEARMGRKLHGFEISPIS